MSYRDEIGAAYGGHAGFEVTPEVKVMTDGRGLAFPVLFTKERADRPFGAQVDLYSRDDCPLCLSMREGKTKSNIVRGMEWLPATYPIKSFHGIAYPAEHRAGILAEDVVCIGAFLDRAGDAVACWNLRGSGASVPEHMHIQSHDFSLPARNGSRLRTGPGGAPAVAAATAFPLLGRQARMISRQGGLVLSRVADYPAFALLVQGPWDLVGRWMATYLAAANARVHNFGMAPGGRLYVIPRGPGKAPSQENTYGASEMLGLITPVTRPAYEAISSFEVVAEALRICGIENEKERLAAEEHAAWAMRHVLSSGGGTPCRNSTSSA
jgi:hypothetical protein